MTPDDPRHGTTTGYRNGCREKCCRKAMAAAEMRRRNRRYLMRVESLRVPNVGTKRRIQALVAMGWSISAVSREAGYDRSHLAILLRRTGPLHVETAARISRVYNRLSMQPPPEETKAQKIDASRARNLAQRRGWPPPLAWDDATIDDPDAEPQGTTSRPKPNGRPLIRDRHIEDAEWMADADETLTSACARLGIKPDSLYAACKRAGRVDVYDRLADRETNGLERADMRNRKRPAA